MRAANEEVSCRNEQAINLILAVKDLHALSSQQLGKLIKDSENNTIQWTTENGSSVQVDVEKLARYLPLHLIARLMSYERDEASFRSLLRGFQLLHSLCNQASRHSKLEQVLLDDVKVSEQLLDLVFYILIILGGFKQEFLASSHTALLHSALVTCSLYLLTACISSQWSELAQVLLAHPKVEIFMSVAFAAVRVDIQFLQIKLSDQCNYSYTRSSPSAEETLNHLSQHCEASLQFLQSLCQQKFFRECVVKNKELCGKGGVLLLAQDIMKLQILPSYKESSLVASISRLKAKVLSILLHLCEVESVSYLDEVASTHGSLGLAKSVALEVVELLKTMFGGDLKELTARSNKTYPRGLLQLNAMRLVDILSDDSNFRSYITIHFTEVLSSIFSLPHGEFLSSWCSSELPVWEEDATLEYDPLAASGWVLDLFSSADVLIVRNSEPAFNFCHVPRASYAHQRTSLLVKVIANLHCFVPDICKEEKDLFLNRFLNIVKTRYNHLSDAFTFKCGAEKAAIICRNLRSLLSHAESLIPEFLNEDDVQLLRVFISQLEPLITPEVSEIGQVQDSKFEESTSWGRLSKLHIGEHHQEAQSVGGCSSPMPRNLSPDIYGKSGNLNEDMSESSAVEEVDQIDVKGNNGVDQPDDVVISGSDSKSMRQKNSVDQMHNFEFPRSRDNITGVRLGEAQEDDKVESIQCEEKQLRKRKRTIMNDKQVAVIEKALIDEPDMQRKAASIQSWADKLSLHGSEVTASQLKNWLNNRKARLARAAAKDVRGPSGANNALHDKQGTSGVGPHYDSPESPVEEFYVPSTTQGTHHNEAGGSRLRAGSNENLLQREPGQYVGLVDEQGEEIGKGYVNQANGSWSGMNLEESGTCVVDITYLKVDRWTRVPYPSEATGTSFGQAENLLGRKRVLWDSNKTFLVQPR